QKRVDEADCIIQIGAKPTDSTTGGFSYDFSNKSVIQISPFSVKTTQEKYAPITMQDALVSLASKLNPKNTNYLNIMSLQSKIKQYIYEEKIKKITQEHYYKQLSNYMK